MLDLDNIRRFVAHLPLCNALGMTMAEGDVLELILPYSDKIIGDPNTGTIHGGAISTLLDTVCGAVVFCHPENTKPTATVDLRIDYMRPAAAGLPVHATAEVYQTTRHIAFVRGLAWDTTREKPVAMATGTFTFAKRVRS